MLEADGENGANKTESQCVIPSHRCVGNGEHAWELSVVGPGEEEEEQEGVIHWGVGGVLVAVKRCYLVAEI